MDGFALNRLQGALLAEAFRLIADDVISPADLDALVKHGLGLRWSFMGPLETIDLNAPGGLEGLLRALWPAVCRNAEADDATRMGCGADRQAAFGAAGGAAGEHAGGAAGMARPAADGAAGAQGDAAGLRLRRQL